MFLSRQSSVLSLLLFPHVVPCLNNETTSSKSLGINTTTAFSALTNGEDGPCPHPDLCPSPSPNLEDEACFTSWSTFLSIDTKGLSQFYEKSTIMPTTYMWETLKSFGVNSTYKDCTDIPRVHFISQPTRTTTSSFAITVWEPYVTGRLNFHNPKWNESETRKPDCGFKERDHYCRRLLAMLEIGPDSVDFAAAPPASLCPFQYSCYPMIDEVVLLYWPKNITSLSTCDSAEHSSPMKKEKRGTENSLTSAFVLTTTAITFRGQDLYLRSVNGWDIWKYPGYAPGQAIPHDLYNELYISRTGRSYVMPSVMTGSWELTYPTVYLAHRPITRVLAIAASHTNFMYRSVARSEGVLSLHPQDLSTVRPVYHTMKADDYAKLVANGTFSFTRDKWWELARSQTVPLNFDDLQEPIPASAYYDARMLDCWGLQSHCGTVTDDSFRPKLRLARRVWSSIFSGYVCREGFLVDPPIVLSRVATAGSLETPRLPSASPASAHATPTAYDGPNQPGSVPSGWEPHPRPPFDFRLPAETGTPRNNEPSRTFTPEQTSFVGRLFKLIGWDVREGRPTAETEKPGGKSIGRGRPLSNGIDQDPSLPKKGDETTGNPAMKPAVFKGQSNRSRKSPSYSWAMSFVFTWIVVF